MKYSNYSAVIVGSGISGLYSALKINQNVNLPDGILLITKSTLGESNSKYAQGGIVAVMKSNKKDSVTSHISDTIKAGAGLSEFDSAKYISENSDKVINDLLNFGVSFDCDENGGFAFTLEAAHSVRRILHSGGDATGRKIEEALVNAISQTKNIDIYENTIAIELLKDTNNTVKGLVTYNEFTGEYETIYTPAVILATGGIGQLYKYTTNPSGATGDGIALAFNANAELQDLEFVQFHPTALAIDGEENRFLISEAVRGEGAKLVDSDGIEFMHNYHELRELAPRDIVTRANFDMMQKNHTDNVWLNATSLDKSLLSKRFPTISKKCAETGIDISKDFIPVAPAAHYFMGGIKTDLYGRSSINGLYAIGETASTGLHGANRLASNSLLECVVCAYSVSEYLKQIDLKTPKKIDTNSKSIIDKYSKDILMEEVNTKEFKQKIQEIMWNGAGIIRNEHSMLIALEQILELSRNFPRSSKCLNIEEYEVKNMLTTARLIIQTALMRKESRGAHFRSDYPNTEDAATHSIITKDKLGELSFVK